MEDILVVIAAITACITLLRQVIESEYLPLAQNDKETQPFLIGKLLMHPVDLELMTSPSTLQGEEVPVELQFIGSLVEFMFINLYIGIGQKLPLS